MSKQPVSVIARISMDLEKTRKRLRENGLAEDLIGIDNIISEDIKKIYFKEKEKRDNEKWGFF